MDIKIKKIFQFGTYGEENGWVNDGETVVIYEDESKAPLHVSGKETYKAFDEYASELGIDTEANPENIAQAIERAAENGLLSFCDKNNTRDMNAALVAIKEAEQKANAADLAKKRATPTPPVVIPPIGSDRGESDPPSPPSTGDDEDSLTPPDDVPEEEITAPEVVEVEDEKGDKLKKGIALGLAGAAGLGAIATLLTSDRKEVAHDPTTETTRDWENEMNQTIAIDFNIANFDELMSSMSEDDPRRQTAETAMNLITNFHEATRKDGNFRLEADGSSYLDLSYEEGLVLALFANNGSTEELYSVLGDYNLTSQQAQDLLESARTKLITYYMNAKEPSGLANIFTNEQDKAFFENFENSVLRFNNLHAVAIATEQNKDATDEEIKAANDAAKTASDDVIRNVYYNYLLDGAASINATEISPLAKLLAFDSVYGGLNLTESASAEHTHHLEFGGLGVEKETEWYVTNILNLDYSSLSEEEKETYRGNIIESGMQLVKLNKNGETMTEDNSTKEELDSASVSITNLVDQMGLCNQANQEISERLEKLNDLAQQKDLQLTIMNQEIARELRDIGSDELDAIANQIEMNASEVISTDLLYSIRNISADSANIVKGYEQSAAFIARSDIPGIEVIIRAANDYTKEQNYAEGIGAVATLINNRLHMPTQKEHEPDDKGYMGEDENGIPTYEEETYEQAEDKEQFIIDNGVVIEEETKPSPTGPTEEVEYDDLNDKEKEEVQVQINEEETAIAKSNAEENGKKGANSYANSTGEYDFGVDSVTNPYNQEVHDLSGKTFCDTINFLVAFGDSKGVPANAKEDEQIIEAAEEAAKDYVNGLSEQEKNDIATAMGISWSQAKDVLMESFKDGYFEQMQNEIEYAIEVGKEHRASAEKAFEDLQQEIAALEAEQNASKEAEVTTPTEPAPTEPEVTTPTEPAPTEPEVTTPTESVPSEDEYDPNIDIGSAEGEIFVSEEEIDLYPQPSLASSDPVNVVDTNATMTTGMTESQMDAMLGNLTDEQIDQMLGVSSQYYEVSPAKTR